MEWEIIDRDWVRGQAKGWHISVFDDSAIFCTDVTGYSIQVQLCRVSSDWPLVVEGLEPTIRRFFCADFDKDELYAALDEGIRRWHKLHNSEVASV